MKKRISRPKLFVKYLLALGILVALFIVIFCLTGNNKIWLGIGILIEIVLGLTTAIVLLCFHYMMWLVWVEDGLLHCRRILTGYHKCFSQEDIYSVSAGYKPIIYINIPDKEVSHSGWLVKLDYNEENLQFVRTFWSGQIIDVFTIAVHDMKLRPEPFEKIKNRQKTFELRLYDEKRQQIKPGDRIAFTNTETGKTLWVTVVKLHRFDSFAQLYQTLPLLQCGYTADDVDKAHPSDMEQYYSVEEQKKYGVVGIEIRRD